MAGRVKGTRRFDLVLVLVIGFWRYSMAGEKKSFGEFLVGLGVLTADQLKKASQEQKQRGERLEQTIVRLGYAKEELTTSVPGRLF